MSIFLKLLASLLLLSSLTSASDLPERGVSLRGHEHRKLQEVDEAVIVTVIDSYTNLSELCYTFQTLVRAKGSPNAPVIAFHGIQLLDGQKEALDGCTSRNVSFEDITDFYASFPVWYVPQFEGANYDYPQSQRFITTWMWDHSALIEFSIIMRISDSTCLTKDDYNLPGFQDQSGTVQYETVTSPGAYETGPKYTRNLYTTAFAHMSNSALSPKNPEMWARVATVNSGFNTLPKFDSDFEIVRKDFMKRDSVRAFHNELTEHQDDFFVWNWGSNTIRYLTLAIYGESHEISTNDVAGIVGKDFLRGNFLPQLCRDVSQLS